MSVNAVDVGSDEIVAELSRVFSQPGEALHLAQRAGFPVADVPQFGTATVFWERLVRAAEDGKLFGGVGAIVAQAKLRFPQRVGGDPGPKGPTAWSHSFRSSMRRSRRA